MIGTNNTVNIYTELSYLFWVLELVGEVDRSWHPQNWIVGAAGVGWKRAKKGWMLVVHWVCTTHGAHSPALLPGAAGVVVDCSQGPPAPTVGCSTALVPEGGRSRHQVSG